MIVSIRKPVEGTKFYRVGQFSGPAPADKEKFRAHILTGDADEVSEDWKPTWGDASYALTPDGEIYTHKENWDSSD